jgi:hypothetical protein
MRAEDVSHKTITEFLTRLVNHSYGVFKVDKDGFVFQKDDPVYFTDTQKIPESHRLIIYREHLTDPTVYILNPFSEAMTLGLEKIWFYDLLLSTNLCALPIIKIMKNLLIFAYGYQSDLEQKEQEKVLQKLANASTKKKKPSKPTIPIEETAVSSIGDDFNLTDVQKLELSEFLNDIAPEITDDIIAQFNNITSNPQTFFKLVFKDTNKTANIHSILFDANARTSFRSIKESTWKLFRTLFDSIFEISSINDLTVKSSSLGYPRLDACMQLFLIIQKTISKYLYLIILDEEERNKFNENIEYFEEIQEHFPKLKRLGGWIRGIPTSAGSKPNIPIINKNIVPITSTSNMYPNYTPVQHYINPNYSYSLKGPKNLENNIINTTSLKNLFR